MTWCLPAGRRRRCACWSGQAGVLAAARGRDRWRLCAAGCWCCFPMPGPSTACTLQGQLAPSRYLPCARIQHKFPLCIHCISLLASLLLPCWIGWSDGCCETWNTSTISSSHTATRHTCSSKYIDACWIWVGGYIVQAHLRGALPGPLPPQVSLASCTYVHIGSNCSCSAPRPAQALPIRRQGHVLCAHRHQGQVLPRCMRSFHPLLLQLRPLSSAVREML